MIVPLICGIVISSLYLIVATKKYSATATIEMNRDGGTSLGLADLSGMATGLGGQDQMNVDLLTQQAVISSDNTALRVIHDLHRGGKPRSGLAAANSTMQSDDSGDLMLDQPSRQREEALQQFRKGLRVNLVKGTRLLTVTYTDPDAASAAAIANAVVDAYRDGSTEARFEATSKTSAWLGGQLADLKQKVEDSQAAVGAFQRTSGFDGVASEEGQPDTPRAPAREAAGRGQEDCSGCSAASGRLSANAESVALERLIELNRELTAAEVARIGKEAIYKMSQSGDPAVLLGIGSSALGAGAGTNSPVSPGSADLELLQQLRQREAQVQVQLAGSAMKYGAKNPVMVQLNTEKASIESQIRDELGRIRERAKSDFDLAELAESGIRRQIAGQEQAVSQVMQKADRLVLLREEAQSNREIYQDLYTKLQEASVMSGIKASNVTLVDPARVPAEPSYPKKKAMLGLGILAGLFSGLATAFLWDYFDDSIVSPEQMEQLTLLPVIGAIPDFHQKQNAMVRYGLALRRPSVPETRLGPWLLEAPRSHTAEAYRALRTALLLSQAEQPPKVILFMSGSEGEGKSTTCLNTAAAFALQGDRVLYLDADLRRAKGHLYFGGTNQVGMSNCLTSGLGFSSALQTNSRIESLSLLAAGPHPPNPSELLGSKRFAALLHELREEFDYILIDSPPVLLVTDAQLIAPLADGYVFVVRSNKTSKRSFERSMAMMRSSTASALGIVVNAMSVRSASYSGYGYDSKGDSYYADESA